MNEDEREQYEERVAICIESGASEEEAHEIAMDGIERRRAEQ